MAGVPKLSVDAVCKDHVLRTAGGAVLRRVLDGVDLQVAPGEFVSLVGPSGAGKTTLLRIIAGLDPATRGRVSIDGRAVSGPGRGRGVVFQSVNLLPWRTALANVALGLEVAGLAKAQARERALHYLGLVGLGAQAQAYPHELSGGMQQRVGIARAMATAPEVMLMDEPFSSLDAQTRELLWDELLALVARTGLTVLFVTHDIDEAIYLSDRVVVLGGSPARVCDDVRIDLPRPRSDADSRSLHGFVDSRRRIRAHVFDRPAQPA